MNRICSLALLGAFAASGAALVGCHASGDIQTDHTATSTDTGSEKKTQTTYDANGNVIQQKTEKSSTPGY